MIAKFFNILTAVLVGFAIGNVLFIGVAWLLGMDTGLWRKTFWPGIAICVASAVWGALGGEPPLRSLLHWLGVL